MLPSDTTTHNIIMTERDGHVLHGEVVFVQRICDVHSEMHIMTSDRLDMGCPEAVHITDNNSLDGCYAPFGCENIEGNRWLFKGVFEPNP